MVLSVAISILRMHVRMHFCVFCEVARACVWFVCFACLRPCLFVSLLVAYDHITHTRSAFIPRGSKKYSHPKRPFS